MNVGNQFFLASYIPYEGGRLCELSTVV